MASIKGIQLKALKMYQTPSGTDFSANLYIDNKKVGQTVDVGDGGPIRIHFDKPEAQGVFEERMKTYFEENPTDVDGEDDFIVELIHLFEAEQMYKKNVKKDAHILITMQFHERTNTVDSLLKKDFKEPILLSITNEDILDELIEERKPVEYQIYRSLEDFKK